jgi:hypothetical protein
VEGVEVVLVVGLGLGIIVFLMKRERLPGAAFFFFNVSFSLYIFFLSWLLALFKIYYINIRKVFYLQHA